MLTPKRFLITTQTLLPILGVITTALFILAFYVGLEVAPADAVQGDLARIMYVHVPAAWFSLGLYALAGLAGFAFLIWKSILAGFLGVAALRVGTTMTLICMITGSLWGKPAWGTWWVWDARLTSVAILLFLSLGSLALRSAYDDAERGDRMCAIFTVVGLLNLPMIKWSVEWWNTLHQPASFLRTQGSAISPEMLWPLLLAALAYGVYSLTMLLWSMKVLILERRS